MSTKEPVVQEPPAIPQTPTQPRQIAGLSEIIQTIKDVSEVADKRASSFLLGLGGALIALALVFKVKLFGITVADMRTSEFISLLVVCFGCLCSGAYVRMLQERLTNDHELRLLETSLRYSLKSQGKTTETALESQELALKPVQTVVEVSKQRPPGG